MCISFFKNIIRAIKESRRDSKQSHSSYYCSDSPYFVLVNEILIILRQRIENTQIDKDKKYLRFLTEYIEILDKLSKQCSQKLIATYFENLKRAVYLEKNLDYRNLLNLTQKSLKLGLTFVSPTNMAKLKDINSQIDCIQTEILKFANKHKEKELIHLYCQILYKLVKLTFIRRGLFCDSISLTSLPN